MENPFVTMVGHLTGRLLLAREPYSLDPEAVIEAAARLGVCIELNSNPYRLDMDWRNWRRARQLGVPCCINPDAHAAIQLGFVDFGVIAAQKGWLSAQDVWNTRPVKEFESLLKDFFK